MKVKKKNVNNANLTFFAVPTFYLKSIFIYAFIYYLPDDLEKALHKIISNRYSKQLAPLIH